MHYSAVLVSLVICILAQLYTTHYIRADNPTKADVCITLVNIIIDV